MIRCVLMLLVFPSLAFGQTDPAQFPRIVRQYAAHYRVPPELIAAFIDVESRWNPRAVSAKGAMGLMQLMPATAKRFGAFDPFNAEQNIAAGTRYVTALMWEFHGDLRLVVAAYYAGDRNIAQEQLDYRNPDVRTLRSPRQQMDVWFCLMQESSAERRCCVTADPDQTSARPPERAQKSCAFLLTLTYIEVVYCSLRRFFAP